MLLAPSPSLPDHTEIKDVQLPTVIGLVLKNAGKRTVGEIRKTPDANLRRYRYPRFGPGRVSYLRKTLGGPIGLST